jgi:dipeptidyl aminopeptidase/acylaminoacyl peptidase
VVLRNLHNLQTNIIYTENQVKDSHIDNIQWIDADTLAISLSSDNLILILAISLHFEANILKSADQVLLPKYGYITDPLINQENSFLFIALQPSKADVQGLYKVKIINNKYNFTRISNKINNKLNVIDATVDPKDGITKFLITYDEEKKIFEYWSLVNKQWEKLKSVSGDLGIEDYDNLLLPEIIDDENNEIIVITDHFNDKNSIVALDAKNMELKRTIFEHDIYDIEAVIINPRNGQLIGAFYFSNGQRKAHYFNQDSTPLLDKLKQQMDGNLYLVDQSNNGKISLLYNDSIKKRGDLYIFNKESNDLTRLFNVAPHFNITENISVKPVTTQSVDQLRIEGFLILPEQINNNTPLLIFPHGGPWAVLDTIADSDLQLYFASKGIASLKINYRGSSGYGRKFLYAGFGEHGKKIEDDIESLLTKTIQDHGFNKNKVCAAGISYGGYSALMLGIRQPELIKCIISVAGPTDIPLNFTSSDYSYKPKVVELAKKLYGDPLLDLEQMKQRSPLYQVKKIKSPVLLIHGELDPRVTIEHSYRLKMAMEKLKKPVSMISYKNEYHGISTVENSVDMANKMIAFIQKNVE